ncbi:MAG: ribonucleoside-diphosphate reductase beta chain [Chloroflexota bacterium]|jgi:ribonucleoside-diphosphate reductase beta chain|nr:ribonucleoside-diphosphate reductase beta chain [Chloroflexota bacterium]
MLKPLTRRTGYATTSGRGIDFDSIPMRLFQKAKHLAWDPQAIDFTQDRREWDDMVDLQRLSVLTTTASFVGGEEAVTLDLLPLVMHVARAGMLEEEIYLTSFLNEEAKHTEFFRRWLDEVTGNRDDLMGLMGPSWHRMFLEELPASLAVLLDDGSDVALTRALTTYNVVVEGVLAETGYHYYRTVLELQGTLQGMLEGIRLIARDESRHLRFGIYMLQRLIAVDDAMWQVVLDRVEELRPLVMGIQDEGQERYVNNARAELGDIPEDLMAMIEMISGETRNFAVRAFDQRLAVLERARGRSSAEIASTPLEEDLETALAVNG